MEELPHQVTIFERTINLEMLEENFDDSVAVHGDSFLTDVFNNSNVSNSSGDILFLCSYAVTLFKHANATGNSTFFLFDSHCKNSRQITEVNQAFQFL